MEWNNLSSILDNGRSKPTNVALGSLGGLLAGGQRQGYFYPQMSWAGNGLARTSLGYIGNPDYVSPYGFSEAMGEAFRKGDNTSSFKQNKMIGNASQNAFARLSGLFKNYDNPFHKAWEGMVERNNKNIGDFGQGLNRYNPYEEDYTLA